MRLPAKLRNGRWLLVAGACALAGCGSRQLFCSLVGCSSGIEVLFGDVRTGFPDAREVSVCANTVCTTYPAGPVSRLCGPETVTGKPTCEYAPATRNDRTAKRLVAITLHSGWLEHTTRMPLMITVLGAHEQVLYSARTVVKLTKTAPNGVKCGPVCFQGGVMFSPRARRFVEFKGHSVLAHELEAAAFVGVRSKRPGTRRLRALGYPLRG
jgi:hypothetical protein